MLMKFLKSSDKNFAQKSSILAFFELTSGSLMTIKVESNQSPSQQFILLTQGPIPYFFVKNIENWWFWKTFRVGHFGFCFTKNFFWKSDKISMIILLHSGQKCLGWWFLAANQSNHQNFENSLLTNFDVFSWEPSVAG